MTCSYCGSRNDDQDHRCRHCGRKPGDTLNGEFTVYRTTGALATKVRPMVTNEASATTTRPPNFSGAVQGSLFTPNVITMPNRGPARTTRSRTVSSATATATKLTTRRPPRPKVEDQGEFEFFSPVQAKTKTLGTTVEARIYCESPVATPVHRVLAAAIDLSMVAIAYGLFLLTFLMCGGEILVNRANLIVFGGAFLLILLAYGLFWTVAQTDSVGMRWTHLRLITFEGFTPDSWQRAGRLAGTLLSLASVLGLLWMLADEERLGWQDHISRTFPSPDELESRVFRRR